MLVSLFLFGCSLNSLHAQRLIDLSKATIVVSDGELPAAEKVASSILSEEVQKRSACTWPTSTKPESVSGAKIFLASKGLFLSIRLARSW